MEICIPIQTAVYVLFIYAFLHAIFLIYCRCKTHYYI